MAKVQALEIQFGTVYETDFKPKRLEVITDVGADNYFYSVPVRFCDGEAVWRWTGMGTQGPERIARWIMTLPCETVVQGFLRGLEEAGTLPENAIGDMVNILRERALMPSRVVEVKNLDMQITKWSSFVERLERGELPCSNGLFRVSHRGLSSGGI